MKTQTTKQSKPRPPVQFETIELYERMEAQRTDSPAKFELEHSYAARRALEYYLIAREKAKGGITP
jgi:hypothetical protein